jgi:hypothetical protein
MANNNNNNNTFFGFKMPSNIAVEETSEDPCRTLWDTGMRVEPTDLKDAVSVKAGQNCRLNLNGKPVYLRSTDMNREPFLQEIPIFTIVPTEDGIYTWIIYSDGSSSTKKQFAACKVRSSYEIGTKHNVIAYRVGAKRIYAAGELKLEGGQSVYNVQSGTFMQPMFEARKPRGSSNNSNNSRRRRYCYLEDFEEFLINELKLYFGPDSVYNSKTCIVALQPTQEELDLYEKHGMVVQVFDTKDLCFEYTSQLGGKRVHRTLTRKRSRSRRMKRRSSSSRKV